MDNKTKAKLMTLIKEKAISEYFVEKMRVRLTRMYKQKLTNNRMYENTKCQYLRFLDKIDELDEAILKLTPTGTDFKDMPLVKIVD
jgi:hypothetical protein